MPERHHRLVTFQNRPLGEVREASRSFLERAARLLAESLDYETTLQKLARLAVPEAADSCTVTLVEEDGRLRAVAGHGDGVSESGSWAIENHMGRDGDPTTGIADVIRHGRPRVTSSSLIVPLVARGRTMGALTFVISKSDRRYAGSDLAWLEPLATHAALAIDNARLYRQSQDAVRVRDDFFSIASHELLTPVTTLRVQIQSLERALAKCRVEAPPGVDLGAKFRTTIRQIDRLTKLVDRLLDASRIAGGTLRLEREDVDLVGIVREVILRFESDAAGAGCVLRFDVPAGAGPLIGHWDPVHVDEVVSNLVANAIKYAPGRPIDLRIEASPASALLFVRDHGEGIDRTDQERIFRRFERASPKGAGRGLGLGLFIAREFARAHGGEIRVESEPGAGAEFVVELPFQPPPEVASVPPPPPAQPPHRQ